MEQNMNTLVDPSQASSHVVGTVPLSQLVNPTQQEKEEAEMILQHFRDNENFLNQRDADFQQDLEEMESDSGKSRREDNAPKTCMAAGCDRTIKRRRLCSTHQKQKERNSGKLELKTEWKDKKFGKGRSPTPFSKHANKYAKLKVFDGKIDHWAGGREEGTVMLQSYMESSYFQSRYPKHEDQKVYETIGRNIVQFLRQLPEKSPLRKPLIKAMSENLPPARLTNILPISKRTIMYSKKLSDNDNLLLTIRYKPNTSRKRNADEIEPDERNMSEDEQEMASQLSSIHSNSYPEQHANMPMAPALNNINGMPMPMPALSIPPLSSMTLANVQTIEQEMPEGMYHQQQ
eukprot:TRINITY_DN8826_c0_g1_i1.p1 TRINITY_DN8826_c0_g1~~TRINITY_DN8826_c0_g1_i1.p1  ORF type:complete len:364 (+),score=95.46 TRINITY_DN8826_c0_g1_i1:56-1093(+)